MLLLLFSERICNRSNNRKIYNEQRAGRMCPSSAACSTWSGHREGVTTPLHIPLGLRILSSMYKDNTLTSCVNAIHLSEVQLWFPLIPLKTHNDLCLVMLKLELFSPKSSGGPDQVVACGGSQGLEAAMSHSERQEQPLFQAGLFTAYRGGEITNVWSCVLPSRSFFITH